MMKNATIFLIVLCGAISFSGKEDMLYKGFNLKKLEKSLLLIPESKLSYYFNEELPKEKWPVENTKEVHVNSFYMYQHEVSNGEYLEFVNEIKKTDTGLYNKMLPDSTVWRNRLAFNEPYVQHYFRHPAYNNYPVVGITYEQAEYYCKWLTEKYMKEGKRKFENAVFKLPKLVQWVSAVKGSCFLRDTKGRWQANFNSVLQTTICREIELGNNTFTRDVETPVWVQRPDCISEPYRLAGTGLDVIVPVVYYLPNNYGLYNMFGNVEEYVKEKGIAKGGSWRDTGYYLQVDVEEKYDSTNYTSAERGFRFVMELVN